MIIFFENGMLGNQLFQYDGLTHYFPKHKLIFYGCSSLQNTFNAIDASFIKSKINSFSYKVLMETLFFLAKFRFLGEIKEIMVNNNAKLYVHRGFFMECVYCS